MSIRLTGMASGLDTESMVTDLMSAYSKQKQKKVSTATKYSWKMDAWGALNKKISSFYSKQLSTLRFASAYNAKKTTVSDTTKATVTASNSAVTGTQTLAVKQLAQAGYLTGGQLSLADKSSVTSSTTMADLGYTGGDSSFTVSTTKDGKAVETKINISADSKIEDVISQLNEAGVNANFDAKNQRIFVSAKESGKDGDFNLVADGSNGIEALKSLGLYTKMTTSESAAYTTAASYVGDDGSLTAAGLEAVAARTAALKEAYGNAAVKNQEDLDKNSAYSAAKALLADEEADLSKYGLDEGDTEEEKIAKILTTDHAEKEARISELATSIEEKAAAIAELDEKINAAETDEEKENLQKEKETLTSEKADLEKESGTLTSENETINNALALQTKRDENYAKAAEGDTTAEDEAKAEILSKGQAAKAVIAADGSISGSAKSAVRIEGQNAEIFLNGAYFTSSTNGFDINGLSITVTGTTGLTEDAEGKTGSMEADDYNTINLTTATDVDGIYDTIKNFLKEYNTLIKEMDTLYNAASAKDYDVLSSEEKDAMSDTEVEEWDKKIKDSLLRRDENLSTVIESMKSAMQKSHTVGDKTYSLASFGIETLSYFLSGDNEKGVYHIDGDADDAETSINEDKLRAAITTDPEGVQSFFVQLTQDMYATMQKISGTSSSSSYGSFYDDKAMKTQYSKYKTDITDFEDKLAKIEEKYYKQFTAMEKAMTKMQSSTSALSSLLGG